MLTIINRTNAVIAVLAFILGFAIMFFIARVGYSVKQQTTDLIVSNCSEGLSKNSELVNNCGEAYKELRSCLYRTSDCDITNLDENLKRLNLEKEQLNNRLDEITKQLNLITTR